MIYLFTEALVTLDVHGKDVLASLCNENVSVNTDFKWLCHLRYYWQVNVEQNLRLSFICQIF